MYLYTYILICIWYKWEHQARIWLYIRMEILISELKLLAFSLWSKLTVSPTLRSFDAWGGQNTSDPYWLLAFAHWMNANFLSMMLITPVYAWVSMKPHSRFIPGIGTFGCIGLRLLKFASFVAGNTIFQLLVIFFCKNWGVLLLVLYRCVCIEKL